MMFKYAVIRSILRSPIINKCFESIAPLRRQRAQLIGPNPNPMEQICSKGQPLAYIICIELLLGKTTFMTLPHIKYQVGFVVYPKKAKISCHTHRPLEHLLIGALEALVVRKERCEIDINNNFHHLIASREWHTGNILPMVDDGHGLASVCLKMLSYWKSNRCPTLI